MQRCSSGLSRTRPASTRSTGKKLGRFAHMTGNLKGQGLDEGGSTRVLVHAGKLIASGSPPSPPAAVPSPRH